MKSPELPEGATPCYQHNPELWRYFCYASGRPVMPSEVWTEQDVVQWLDRAGAWPDDAVFVTGPFRSPKRPF